MLKNEDNRYLFEKRKNIKIISCKTFKEINILILKHYFSGLMLNVITANKGLYF